MLDIQPATIPLRHQQQRIHCAGVGGIGVSGVAKLLHQMGHVVTGSDRQSSAAMTSCQAMGIAVHVGHSTACLDNVDLLVVSSALPKEHPLCMAATQRGVPMVSRGRMLAHLMDGYQSVAVAGTHGKTTVSSMVAHVLDACGRSPSYAVGGFFWSDVSGDRQAQLGGGDWFVAESDESDASFLHMCPTVAVVTAIAPEHMATYGHDEQRLNQAFETFLSQVPDHGAVVVSAEALARLPNLMARARHQTVVFGGPPSQVGWQVEPSTASGTQHAGQRVWTYRVRTQGCWQPTPLTLHMPGRHNATNALAAVAAACAAGVPLEEAIQAMASFHGVRRRCEPLGVQVVPSVGQLLCFDDYGHHPNELAAQLNTMRTCFKGQRLVMCWQPHRFSRTDEHWDAFVEVLSSQGPDVLVLSPVYAAGETAIPGRSSADLANTLRANGADVVLSEDGAEGWATCLEGTVQDGDVVWSQGAGSISAWMHQWLSTLQPGGSRCIR